MSKILLAINFIRHARQHEYLYIGPICFGASGVASTLDTSTRLFGMADIVNRARNCRFFIAK